MRKPKAFWLSRDKGTDTEGIVMVTSKKPKVDDSDTCETCSQPLHSIRYLDVEGVSFGYEGELCYSGWLKLTGIAIEPGELKKIAVIEV